MIRIAERRPPADAVEVHIDHLEFHVVVEFEPEPDGGYWYPGEIWVGGQDLTGCLTDDVEVAIVRELNRQEGKNEKQNRYTREHRTAGGPTAGPGH